MAGFFSKMTDKVSGSLNFLLRTVVGPVTRQRVSRCWPEIKLILLEKFETRLDETAPLSTRV